MYTDMHCHLIWGVDDGAETREETVRMLFEAVGDGIGTAILTPHVTPGVYRFHTDRFEAHLAEAREVIEQEKLPLKLLTGAELLYTEQTPRMLREKQVPTLAGSRYALVEFSPTDSWDHILEAVRKVAGAGVVPVIAHMERYPAVRSLKQVHELKNRSGALVQINARSLLVPQPLLRRRFFDQLFREGLVDFVATDTHSMPGRNTCMTDGMNALAAKYGRELAQKIQEAPEHLLL